YRIGVDVGGTNTDAALAAAIFHNGDQQPKVKIVGSSKSPTTSDVTTGICSAIRDLLSTNRIAAPNILSINIGTTHFVNAIVQADQQKLAPVAVLRLCGPFCREVPPFVDFPRELREVVEGPVGYLNGGLEIDGRVIASIDEDEVIRHAHAIVDAGISTVVVNGVFSPLDSSPVTQEEQVRKILERHIPRVDVVCSRDIGRVGYLERENAAILNAAILAFGRMTISRFQKAVEDLGIDCPLYLTQNDGTVLDAHSASLAPIRTFSSGATNSLIGALFLSGIHEAGSEINLKECQVIMCDIGGTTSDFAALSLSGLPRESPATVKIGGVRTAFSMPEVLSIGLGGGSEVREDEDGIVKVGPISVGHLLLEKSRCFGGSTLTATDVVVASGGKDKVTMAVAKVQDVSDEVVQKGRQNIRKQLERGVDIMKTSDAPVVLLLVGGGSIILMDDLENVEKCIRPQFSDVANAVGAAIAKISGDVDSIIIPGQKTHEEIKNNISARATDIAITNGAQPGTVEILDLDLIPIQYTNNGAVRAIAKGVGDLGWDRRPRRSLVLTSIEAEGNVNRATRPSMNKSISILPAVDIDIVSYRPKVSKATGEWFISPTDLLFILEGTGILGTGFSTGGGGSGYTAYLNSLYALSLAEQGKMRVIDPGVLKRNDKIATVAYVGAPSVSNERLIGDSELQYATEALAKYEQIDGWAGVLAAEIGGSNGMRTFTMAAAMDIPVIDADTMGRAFPRVDMSLPYVFKAATPVPSVVSEARGNVQIVAQAENATRFENMVRTISVELGLYTAMALILSGSVIEKYCCHRSLSASWFIGRAVCMARALKMDVVESLVADIPGGRKLYSGKIINVSRTVKGGWTIGTATLSLDDEVKAAMSEDRTSSMDERPLVLQYQNEFLYAALQNQDSSLEALCTTPDLITVLDQNGTAIGTHELRYGLRVSVISMPADPLWKTPEGMKAGGPDAFGIDMEYKEYGAEWKKPRSVIAEFGV
ncbi:putative Hydantoinase/oxoprolinase, partial [Exophiala viscosa]|uniref:putative Hydantoinase/oxoprolinase n=1 Tax=Exophiala viscosa TaxID=2486360 RepID=UPI00219D38C9